MGKIDITGQVFCRLTVVRENGRTKDGKVLYLCKCSCGNEVTVRGRSLRRGLTKSCGCLARERASERMAKLNTTHGMYRSRLYSIWHGVLHRTGAIKGASDEEKRDYLDRSITICNEWRTFPSFCKWSLDNGYSDDLEIDRIDNNRGYFPDNCRWVSRKENANNRRCTLRLPDGTSLAMFCSEVGIQTCKNGQPTRQYLRIKYAYSKHHKAHPELLAIANEYLTLLRRLRASLDLLKDVREFRKRCNASQMISLPET